MRKQSFQLFLSIVICVVLSRFICGRRQAIGRSIVLTRSNTQSTLSASSAAALCLSLAMPFYAPLPSYAIDPSELRQYASPEVKQSLKLGSKQGNIAEELKKYKETQDALDMAEVAFTELPSGVSYREYREGKGNRVVQKGSTVDVEMSIRCESLTTGSEPQGVKYYSTKADTPTNSLVWTIGSGELLPGLEEAMIGMKRNSIRRIEVPSVQVFAARDNKQLPLPAESNEDGQRRFRNLFKTKADLLIEVLVNNIQDPVVTAASDTVE